MLAAYLFLVALIVPGAFFAREESLEYMYRAIGIALFATAWPAFFLVSPAACN